MSYPSELLPKDHFRCIETDNLPPASFLLRKSNNPLATSLDEVRVDELFRFGDDNNPILSDFYGYSTNLFGKYLEEHLVFIPNKKEYSKKWNPGDEVLNEDDISYDEDKNNPQAIFLPIVKLHKVDFPYSKKKKVKKVEEVEGKRKVEFVFETEDFIGMIEVVHEPTLCNFWHYELHIIDQDGNEIKNAKKGSWKEDAVYSFLGMSLKHFASKQRPPINEIPEELYS